MLTNLPPISKDIINCLEIFGDKYDTPVIYVESITEAVESGYAHDNQDKVLIDSTGNFLVTEQIAIKFGIKEILDRYLSLETYFDVEDEDV